jgi:hypothetical protein
METEREQEDMAQKRLVDCAIWENDDFGGLTYFQQLLWIGLFTACADDQGRYLDNPHLIRAKLWPFTDVPIEDIQDGMATFEALGWTKAYTADGKALGQILGWWEHQPMQWAGYSKWQPPEGWQDRVRTRQGDRYICINWKGEGGDNTQPPEPAPAPAPKPKRTRKPPEPESPAVKLYRDITRVRCNRVQAAAINKAVQDIPKWGEIIKAWRLAGYNPTNVAAMLEWYSTGIPRRGAGKAKTTDIQVHREQDLDEIMRLNNRDTGEAI